MDLTMTLPGVVYVVWGTVLAVVVVVIVPLAIGLLQRTLNAALSIRRYLLCSFMITGTDAAKRHKLSTASSTVYKSEIIKLHIVDIRTRSIWEHQYWL